MEKPKRIEDVPAFIMAHIADGQHAIVEHGRKAWVFERRGDRLKRYKASTCPVCVGERKMVIARSCVLCNGYERVWGWRRRFGIALMVSQLGVFAFAFLR
jgi:hypothetical protein